YYVYALLDDISNAPVVAYSASPVTINDTTPPAVPTNLRAIATGSDVAVSWQASPDVDVGGYHIAYQQPGNGQTLVINVPSGQQTNAMLHGLNINGTWQLSISAYDLNGNESARSAMILVPVSAVATFLLTTTAGGTASANPPATSYPAGTNLTLTASANTGYTFISWTVDGRNAGKANPFPFTVTGNHAIVANFAATLTATSVAPVSGPTSGGSDVTITGTGLNNGSIVTIGGIPATIVSGSATAVTVVAPPHAAGMVDITVTGGGQQINLSQAYIYITSPLPPPQPTAPPPTGGAPAPIPGPRPTVPAVNGTPNPLPPHR
ncbi:MAG: IPT/TIG domain-containing protein, partial [Thermomicrobia bacterium]|nr:IPT/TIG domain-containing protein [Thermomicrobia bacterium]